MIRWLQKVASVGVDRMPSKISPGTHAMIDYGLAIVTAIFAIRCLRTNKAAAVAGIMASLCELTNIAMTDVPGGICKEISFPLHGRIDMGNSAMLAAMPKMMGFADDPESKFFYATAVASTVVTGLTDYTGTGATNQSQALLAAKY